MTYKKKWGVYVQGTPANLRRPVPESDYLLILGAMKSNPLPQDIETIFASKVVKPLKKQQLPKISEKQPSPEQPKHNEIRDMIVEIGNIQGKLQKKNTLLTTSV